MCGMLPGFSRMRSAKSGESAPNFPALQQSAHRLVSSINQDWMMRKNRRGFASTTSSFVDIYSGHFLLVQ